MELVKNISACIGAITGIFALATLLSEKVRGIWSNIFAKYGNNEKLTAIEDFVKKIEEKLDSHIESERLKEIKSCRTRILQFADKLRHGDTPDLEYTNEVMSDIDEYELYCVEHPNYPNSRAVESIKKIKQYYLTF